MPPFPSILDDRHLELLRAALGEDERAVEAFRSWRSSEKLDETDDTVYRVLPLLLATAERAGLRDPERPRMRGAVKHIWLTNMFRIRDLAEAKAALDAAGIESLLFKGGALFARNERFAAMRAAGDYDLLVRRDEAARAVETLHRASFRGLGMQVELFSERDFDRDVHAVAMTKTQNNRAVDLHWWPLPALHDRNLTEELFANAETAELSGAKVLIPGLADHLFLAAVRAEPWDHKEIFLRAIEITHLLRSCHGELDWGRFEALVARYEMGWIAAPLLCLVRDELAAPMKHGLVERLWRKAPLGNRIELSIRRSPPDHRGPWQNFVLTFFEAMRSQPRRPVSWRDIFNPATIFRTFSASALQFPLLKRGSLKRLWARHAKVDRDLADGEACFVQGFSIPESDGRWTDAEHAVIEIGIGAAIHANAKIVISIIPFIPQRVGSFEFEVYAGVGTLGQYKLTSSDPMPFRLETDALVVSGTTRKAVVVLRMPNLVRPNQIGHSVDHRLLGLLVKSVGYETKV